MLRILLVVVILLVLVVGWIVFDRLPACCGNAPDDGSGGNGGGGRSGGPGRGSEIIVKPKLVNAVLMAEWKIGIAAIEAGNAEQSGFLRDDAYGEIALFQGQNSATGQIGNLNRLRMTIAGNAGTHEVKVERNASGEFSWTLDASPLVICEAKPAQGGPEDCQQSGLPPAFFGEIQSIDMTPWATPPPDPVSDVGQVRMQSTRPQ